MLVLVRVEKLSTQVAQMLFVATPPLGFFGVPDAKKIRNRLVSAARHGHVQWTDTRSML